MKMRMLLLILGITLSCQSFGMSTDSIRSYVYCVEDYKFIYTHSNSSNGGVTVTQILEYSGHNSLVPMGCDGSEPYRVAYEGIKTKK